MGVMVDGRGRELLDERLDVQAVDLLEGSFGCSHSGHVGLDPYWNRRGDVSWHDLAAGDGRSYGGVVETIRRLPGEQLGVFLRRARDRAKELDVPCDEQ